MSKHPTTSRKTRGAESIPTIDTRTRGLARVMRNCGIMAFAMGIPCGMLSAAVTTPIDLGNAADFGALAGGAISGTGHVTGDIGSGTGAIAPAITSTGTIYPTGDAATMSALADFAAAYDEGMNRQYDVLLSAAAYELGGTTLTPGVYAIGAAATLATPVTLDAGGDPDAVFIIRIAGAFGTTASTGNVILTNEASGANVFWIVEGAVSMGASSHMEGNILGGAAITCGATTTLNGRALAGSPAGTLALATSISVPVEPSLLGGRVWFDADMDGIQDPSETDGIADVPVTLMRLVQESLTLDLGSAADFGVLAGGAISGTGHVAGNVGSGTGAIAPAITSDGTVFPTGHADAMAALIDFSAAYEDGMNRTPDVLLSAAAYELGGSTLAPGVHRIGAAATLVSQVTLDAGGDPDAVFIIQIVGAFGTTASTGNVILANEAGSANVFWIVEGAVSLGADTHMEGNILGGAAITFGAGTTISGRALAGAAAGTVALATTVSQPSGTPPMGFPPPVVAAQTVTDANGNYQFQGVPPGIFIIRWNLTEISSTLRISPADQGEDDSLDSDGVSGDVGGMVDAAEIEVLAGTTLLTVDLGLMETLPAIKQAAKDALESALVIHLLANDYTSENWNALRAAKSDGNTAIDVANDPSDVNAAKNSALAAMAAVPTFDETMAAARISAMDELQATMDGYLEADFTAGNWTILNTAKLDGDTAIQAATHPDGVAYAMNTALAAMDAVPTIAETLAAAKADALDMLAVALAAHLEDHYYTYGNWIALKDAKSDGDMAIHAATDAAGVAAAMDAALAAMDSVEAMPSANEAPDITGISRTPDGDVTLVLKTIPNRAITLQTSTDLRIWETITTVTPVTDTWSFVHDATLASGPNRFYRAFFNP